MATNNDHDIRKSIDNLQPAQSRDAISGRIHALDEEASRCRCGCAEAAPYAERLAVIPQGMILRSICRQCLPTLYQRRTAQRT